MVPRRQDEQPYTSTAGIPLMRSEHEVPIPIHEGVIHSEMNRLSSHPLPVPSSTTPDQESSDEDESDIDDFNFDDPEMPPRFIPLPSIASTPHAQRWKAAYLSSEQTAFDAKLEFFLHQHIPGIASISIAQGPKMRIAMHDLPVPSSDLLKGVLLEWMRQHRSQDTQIEPYVSVSNDFVVVPVCGSSSRHGRWIQPGHERRGTQEGESEV